MPIFLPNLKKIPIRENSLTEFIGTGLFRL